MASFKFLRLFFLPLGLANKLIVLAKEGARDIHNQVRFKDAQIDDGCCINQNSVISPNTHILNNCVINNSQIASYSYIGKNCLIQNTKIGKFCSIANDVFIGLGNHPTDHFSTSPLFYRTNNPLNIKFVDSNSDFQEYHEIEVGNDVWIGARAIILDGVTIGHGAIIAANSVVTKDVPPYSIVGGIPSKIIKYRLSDERIERLIQSCWWNWDISIIKKHFKE